MAEAQDPVSGLAGRMRGALPAMEKPARMHLLELPLDILKAILKEVSPCLFRTAMFSLLTHLQLPQTNDLTVLALTNSTLHGLVYVASEQSLNKY